MIVDTKNEAAALKFSRPLWAHQSEELVLSYGARERALLWEMGTGKTTAAIGWLRLKYRQEGRVLKTLILSPVATLPNWKREFERNSPESVSTTVTVCYGPGAKRIPLIASGQIIVTNPEALTMPTVLAALKAAKFEAIVIDEAHRFKSPDSKRFKALLGFSDAAKYRMILTGTLILNSYMDVWAPWRFLDKGRTFGTNFYSHFRRKYFIDVNAGMPPGSYFPDWQPIKGLEKILSQLLSEKASRKTKEECLTLPPRIFQRIPVALSKEQERLYLSMEQELIATVGDAACAATNALVKVTRMLQILSGYIALEEQGEVGIKDCPRLEALEELLEDLTPQSKVVVWATFKRNYKDLRALCDKMGLGYAELTGDTKDRQAEIDRFVNDPKCRVFLSNPQAGGTGVDGLQHVARYAIYYTRSYSLGDRKQSLDRIHRGGSEVHDKVTVYDLVAENTLDEDVLDALDKKEEFAEDVLARLRSRYAGRR